MISRNYHRQQQRSYSTGFRTFLGVLGTTVAVMGCGTSTPPGGGDGGGGGGGPNTEQKGTWTDRGVIATPGYGLSLAASSDGKKVVAGVVNGHVYTSADLGKPLIDRSAGDAAGNIYWMEFASSSDGVNLSAIARDNPDNKYIFTSTNSGETWTDHTPKSGDASGHLKWQSIASSSDGVKLVALVNQGHIYSSGDSGKTWKDISPSTGDVSGNQYWNQVVSSNDGQKLAALAGGFFTGSSKLFTSDDSGGQWKERIVTQVDNISTFLVIYSVASSADGKYLVVAGDYVTQDKVKNTSTVDPKVFISDNFGSTWNARTPTKLSDTSVMNNIRAGNNIHINSAVSTDGTRIAILVRGEGSPTNLLFTSATSGASWFEQTLYPQPTDTTKAYLLGVTSSSDGRVLNFPQAEILPSSGNGPGRFRVLTFTFP